MSEQHYKGSCQCGAVAFEADVDLDNTITCNCSRCQRMGFVLAFTTQAKITLTSGEGCLTEFTFNTHKIKHRFCNVCGVEPFAMSEGRDGTPRAAVNVNCLDGVDPQVLKSKHVDGKSF